MARKRGIPLMEDLGSGALFDLRSVGISGEPGVLDSLRSGVDIVTYSGDKLLGGPQAGLISGGSELIARMRSNSLFRALRVDKLIYAALEATLLAYVRRDHDAIPTLRMMRLTKEAIGERAEAVAAQIAMPKLKVEIVDGESILGGGAAPSSVLPTRVLALTCEGLSADELAARLRGSEPPIIARVEEGRVLLDLRTVFPEQDVARGGRSQPHRCVTFSHRSSVGSPLHYRTFDPPIEELIETLHTHAIKTLVDIRAFPMSRRLPQFNRESLEKSLPAAGIRYVWMKALGGYRKKSREDSPNIALRNASFRNYADYMLTPEFESAMAELIALAENFTHRVHVRRARILPLPSHAGFRLAVRART